MYIMQRIKNKIMKKMSISKAYILQGKKEFERS